MVSQTAKTIGNRLVYRVTLTFTIACALFYDNLFNFHQEALLKWILGPAELTTRFWG
jgi:hypothetical protein